MEGRENFDWNRQSTPDKKGEGERFEPDKTLERGDAEKSPSLVKSGPYRGGPTEKEMEELLARPLETGKDEVSYQEQVTLLLSEMETVYGQDSLTRSLKDELARMGLGIRHIERLDGLFDLFDAGRQVRVGRLLEKEMKDSARDLNSRLKACVLKVSGFHGKDWKISDVIRGCFYVKENWTRHASLLESSPEYVEAWRELSSLVDQKSSLRILAGQMQKRVESRDFYEEKIVSSVKLLEHREKVWRNLLEDKFFGSYPARRVDNGAIWFNSVMADLRHRTFYRCRYISEKLAGSQLNPGVRDVLVGLVNDSQLKLNSQLSGPVQNELLSRQILASVKREVLLEKLAKIESSEAWQVQQDQHEPQSILPVRVANEPVSAPEKERFVDRLLWWRRRKAEPDIVVGASEPVKLPVLPAVDTAHETLLSEVGRLKNELRQVDEDLAGYQAEWDQIDDIFAKLKAADLVAEQYAPHNNGDDRK